MLKISNLSKAQREDMMCGVRNGRAVYKLPNMTIAESDYEHCLANSYDSPIVKSKFDEAKEILEREDL